MLCFRYSKVGMREEGMVLGIRVIFIGKEIFFLKYFCDFTFIVYWRYMFYGIIFSFKGG